MGSKEFTVEHVVRQVVIAETADEAERKARKAIEFSPALWWPVVAGIGRSWQTDG